MIDAYREVDGEFVRLEPRELAVIAAAQATEAAAELLRFNREGPGYPSVFGEVEVVEKLAEALARAIECEQAGLGIREKTSEYVGARAHLLDTCARFIDEWVG